VRAISASCCLNPRGVWIGGVRCVQQSIHQSIVLSPPSARASRSVVTAPRGETPCLAGA
jgi:hypothetical protein